MKIAIYSGTIPSTTFIEKLISGVAKKHSVYLFGIKKGAQSYSDKNIFLFTTPQSRLQNLLVTVLRLIRLTVTNPARIGILKQELKKYKSSYAKRMAMARILPVLINLPDVFHIQWAKDLDKWIFLKEKLNVRIILSLRGAHINYSPIANKELARSYEQHFPKVDGFHAVSEDIKNEAERYAGNLDKIKVIHTPITDDLLSLENESNKEVSDKIKICSVGRFHWIKGMRYLIDALIILKEKKIDFEYLCVSSNAPSEEFLFKIHQAGLQDQVIVKTKLPQDELFPLMQSCDVLVLPSLKEGLANVVLEAMALRIPVIATDGGGMREVVKHKETGWLVPVRNAQAIAGAIEEIHSCSEEKLKSITNRAHDSIKRDFKALDSIAAFDELYESVMLN